MQCWTSMSPRMGFREPGERGAKQPGSWKQGGKDAKEQGAGEVIQGARSRGKNSRKHQAEEIQQGVTQKFLRD